MKKRIAALIMSLIIIGSSTAVWAEDIPKVIAETTVENTGAVEKITVDTAIQTTADGQYTFSKTSDSDGSVLIRKYQGTDVNVSIPAWLIGADGNQYTVGYLGTSSFEDNKSIKTVVINEGIKEIGDYVFYNSSVETIVVPSTIYYIGMQAFGFANHLVQVNVSQDSQYFYDVDGVLFEKNCYDKGVALVVYPPMREGESYVIPEGVRVLSDLAFDSPKYLKELIIPSSVTGDVWNAMVYKPSSPMTIFVKLTDISKFFKGAFVYLPSGSKIIVKNDTVKAAMPEKLKNCDGTEILSLTDADVKNTFARTATNLTFSDGTKAKNITLSRGGTYSLQGCFTQTPMDTTENVTWSSTDETIAYIDNTKGIPTITAKVSNYTGGNCQIVGVDESGHKIEINVYAYEPVTGMSLIYGDNRESTGIWEVSLEQNEDDMIGVAAYVTPYYANHAKDVVWSSSDENVAAIEYYGNREYNKNMENYGLITPKKAGTTTITATINDDGNIISKQFTLKVKSAANNNGSNQNENGTQKQNIDVSKVKWTATTLSYNGKNQSVSLTGLPKGVTVSYSNATKKTAGKYTATATLSYDSTKYNTPAKTTYTTTWYIRNNQAITFQSKNVKNGVITVPYGTKAFQLGGSAKTAVSYSGGNSKVAKVDSNGKVTIKGTGYTTITVSAKQSNSYNKTTKKLVVYVAPKKEKLTSLKSNKKAEMTVKWSKDAKASGYQIQYATKSNFKNAKSSNVSGNKNTSLTITKLSKGMKYYARVRAYVTVKIDGKSVKKYGAWSNVNSVNVKR